MIEPPIKVDPVWARGGPFLLFIAFLVVSANIDSFLPSTVSREWLLPYVTVARGMVVGMVLVWLWPSYVELKNPKRASITYWLLAVLCGLAVFVIWIQSESAGGEIANSAGFIPIGSDGKMNWSMALLRLLGLAVVVPVMEELFWRSLILRWIDQHDFLALPPERVGHGALAITTVLFALEHEQWVAGAIAGCVYALLYKKTGNLWVPILSHAVTNGALGIWIIFTGNWSFW